jgi:hypothetical protein
MWEVTPCSFVREHWNINQFFGGKCKYNFKLHFPAEVRDVYEASLATQSKNKMCYVPI